MSLKTEKIKGIELRYFADAVRTERLSCKDATDVQRKVNVVLKKHPDWKVSSLDFKTECGELCGEIYFRPPTIKPKTKIYEVSWVERYDCCSTVEAKDKEEARRIAEEEFPDDKEYEGSSQWKIKEIKRNNLTTGKETV